jgi:putative transposase
MPRSARLDSPGILQHIIIRGIERKRIFTTDDDREDFIKRLAHLLPETKTGCYAWALMGNHGHFLFRSGPSGIPQLMRRLLTGYSVSYNRRYRRHGHLFQNRYKSIICQEDAYLQELVRYIHLNPLRGRLVNDIEALHAYPYSGHSALMGRCTRPWQDTEYVLSLFGRSITAARSAYASYVADGIALGKRPELTGGGLIRSMGGWKEFSKRVKLSGERIKADERILGDSDFVLSVLSEANEQLDHGYALKRRGFDLNRIANRVEELLGAEPGSIYSKGRRKEQTLARSLFCYWAVRELGMSNTDVGKKLGISQPAVGYAVRKGEAVAKKHGFQLEK